MNKEESEQRYTKFFFYQIFFNCNRGCDGVGITGPPARVSKRGTPCCLQPQTSVHVIAAKSFFLPKKNFFLLSANPGVPLN